MEYGYCSTTLVPCRAEGSDRSEMVNQLLFGETYQVLETTDNWVRVVTLLDRYEAWIDRKLHCELSEEQLHTYRELPKTVVNEPVVQLLSLKNESRISLSYGAILPASENGTFSIGSNVYRLEAPLNQADASLTAFSTQFLNAPYLWGGKSLFGADCSGFTQVVFRIFDRWIPRDAWQQELVGTAVELENVLPGDLAFFGKKDGKITHVGICMGSGKIIHCSGRCRIDLLDEKGILNTETNSYSHDLRSIKRL
ncbi:MAG: C40 family peptidase [Bacteroidota bacterium]